MGIPDRDGVVPDRGWDKICRQGSKHGMMGYQTWDDGVPGRGRVATLMSHQSEILHSLIFVSIERS